MPLRRCLGRAAGLVLLAAATPAQAMPVREFLARWERLGKLGEMVKLDPDAKALARELRTILEGFRIDVDAAKAAGTPIACLPIKGEAKFSSGPLITYLTALPPAEQEAELKAATYAFLTRTYPC